MARKGNGVELREKSIRVNFTHNGNWIRETLDWEPTPANEAKAAKLVARVKAAIKDGSFTFADHFPNSKNAGKAGEKKTLKEMGDLWLKTKGRLATKTQDQYRNAVGVWVRLIGGDRVIDAIKHSELASLVGGRPWSSAKLLNNYLIVLRGIFKLAGRDMKLDNPMEGIENSKHQAAAPDPLSVHEMRKILEVMYKEIPVVVAYYYEFAFLTGMRPEELIALRWADVDFGHCSIRVQRARTAGEYKPLKTYNVRDVDLVPRAMKVLTAMKEITQGGNDGYIFRNPVTHRPWHDERSQRDHYWKPCLIKAKVRMRRSYQTRHTYAANALMGGVNPAYIARQMGHKSAKMLFSVYAKWIDGADRGREASKLEAAFDV